MNINIDEAKFRRLDLNLLLVFSAMLRERSVTRAASKLFLGQPAVSAALSRLREATGDKLFVRGASGMEPTARALQLAEQLKPALESIEAAFFRPSDFDPATAEHTFRIRLSDSLEIALFPPLMERLHETAPGLRFSFRGWSSKQAREELDDGLIDLAIGVFDSDVPRYSRISLGVETFATIYNPALVPIEPPLTLDDYVKYPHLLTSFSGDMTGIIDEMLDKAGGLKRTVLLSTPRFLGLPYYLQAAPYLASMPLAVAKLFARDFGLAISPTPLPVDSIEISVLWHARSDSDAALQWLIRELTRTATEILELSHPPVTSMPR